jgi:pseudaminic acid biosynthesis-associated methylase
MEHMTEQLALWRGKFGEDYIGRNEVAQEYIQPLTLMWAKMLANIKPASILEVGANIGLNLRAIQMLSAAELTAIEPNETARNRIVGDRILPAGSVHDGFAAQLPFADSMFDLAFTSGVLIHIHPDDLRASCKEIARVSRRYIICSEYFSVSPREIPYRGHNGALFSRDFGKLYMETCPEIRLLDYGFFWTGAGCVDDLTWWLFEKPISQIDLI